MEVRCRPAVMCCVFAILSSVVPRSLGSSYRDRQYLNEWAVEIPGGLAAAEGIARELDYQLVRQVSTTPTPRSGSQQQKHHFRLGKKTPLKMILKSGVCWRFEWILFIWRDIKAKLGPRFNIKHLI